MTYPPTPPNSAATGTDRAAPSNRGTSAPAEEPHAPPPAHYENFPVASLLCPPHMRPAVAALYAFARTADDIADEGDAPPAVRLAELAAFRGELDRAAADASAPAGAAAREPGRWPEVFGPLRAAIARYRLPVPLLADLLDAFAQDIRKSRDRAGYADRSELLDYCRRSANPIGRLLLHLYGVDGPVALAQSDAICTALQLANFWQDPSVDLPRGRRYFTDADCARFGIDPVRLMEAPTSVDATKLIADCAAWTRATMLQGAPLVHTVPGRAGWELRLVVQGGLRILDRIEALGFRTVAQRPVLRAYDWPVMAARALAMRRAPGSSRPIADNRRP